MRRETKAEISHLSTKVKSEGLSQHGLLFSVGHPFRLSRP